VSLVWARPLDSVPVSPSMRQPWTAVQQRGSSPAAAAAPRRRVPRRCDPALASGHHL